MGRVVEPGKFANWIAPPVMGINRQPVDFDYAFSPGSSAIADTEGGGDGTPDATA